MNSPSPQPPYSPSDLQVALALHKAGRNAEAEPIYRRILEDMPDNIDATQLLGTLCLQTGRPEEAIDLLMRAVRARPDSPVLLNNLGEACRIAGRFPEAIRFLLRATEVRSGFFGAWMNLGTACREARDLEAARSAFQRALSLEPRSASAHTSLGGVHNDLGDLDEAIRCYRRALALDRGHVPANVSLVATWIKQGKHAEAAAFCEDALRSDPSLAIAHVNMAQVHRGRNQLRQAEQSLRTALELAPDLHEARSLLGAVLEEQGHYAQALIEFERVPAGCPASDDAAFYRSMALLRLGRIRDGWPDYERRFLRALGSQGGVAPPATSVPMWRGESLAGKSILLCPEQGFGDNIQFSRYLIPLSRMARDVTLLTYPELVKIFRSLPDNVTVIPNDSLLETRTFDYWSYLLSLPHRFGTTIDSIPGEVPYLRPDPAAVQRWYQHIGKTDHALKVGIVGSGAAGNPNDAIRSIPEEILAPLFALTGVRYFALKNRPAPESGHANSSRITDLGPEIRDFDDLAAILANMDLLISVDTAPAHLAGALARPVWTLLPFVPDWRWMLDREDSPWYPTMRLFRQPKPGDWDSVIQRVTRELAAEFQRRTTANEPDAHRLPVDGR